MEEKKTPPPQQRKKENAGHEILLEREWSVEDVTGRGHVDEGLPPRESA